MTGELEDFSAGSSLRCTMGVGRALSTFISFLLFDEGGGGDNGEAERLSGGAGSAPLRTTDAERCLLRAPRGAARERRTEERGAGTFRSSSSSSSIRSSPSRSASPSTSPSPSSSSAGFPRLPRCAGFRLFDDVEGEEDAPLRVLTRRCALRFNSASASLAIRS